MGIFSGVSKAVGGLLGAGGGGVPNIPQSPEEKALIEEQRKLSERFTPIFGDFAEQILSGKVPVSPQLEQQLMEQEKTIREDISRRLGPRGAAQTTAGIQRIGQFQTGANIAREEARRSLIPAAFQAVQSASGLQRAALTPLQQERGLQQRIAEQQAAQEAQQAGAFGQLLGGAGSGALLAGLTGGTSLLGGAALGALGGGSAIPFLGGQQGGGSGAGVLSTPKTVLPKAPQRRLTLASPQLKIGR